MNIKQKVIRFFEEPFVSLYDELEILIETQKSVLARFSDNEMTQHVSQKRHHVRFRVIKNGRTGVASTNNMEGEHLVAGFEKALNALSFMPESKDLLSLYEDHKKVEVKQSLYHLTHEKRALNIKKALEYVESADMKAAGIDTEVHEHMLLLNSKGLEKESFISGANFSVSITSPNKGWAQDIKNNALDIDHMEVVKRAVAIAKENQDAIALEAKAYDVVLTPEAAADLFSFLAWYGFNGKAFYEKTGPFNSLETQVLGENITIIDEPLNSEKPGHAFDYEGVQKKNQVLVEKGVLKQIALDRSLGEKLGLESTGHSRTQPNTSGAYPINLVVEGGNSSKEEMIQSTKYGLYINRFHYTNIINPKDMTFTGMTRDGVFLIENGEIKKAVKNLRFTDSIIRLLHEVELLSKERRISNEFMSPEFTAKLPFMKIKGFRFSSTTDF